MSPTPTPDPALPLPAQRPTTRTRLFRLFRSASAAVLTTLLLLGLIGHLLRDRTVWLAALMYLPILPLGLLSILHELLPPRRPLRRRWAGLLGGVAVVLSVASLTGGRPHHAQSPASPHALTLLH